MEGKLREALGPYCEMYEGETVLQALGLPVDECLNNKGHSQRHIFSNLYGS